MRWDPILGMYLVYEKGGGGGQTSTTTTAVNYSPEEAAQRAKVQEEAARIYGQTAETITGSPYPGSVPVGFSPETMAARGMISNYATGTGQQQAQGAADYSSWVMGPAQYAEANPYLQSNMAAAIRPVTEAYQAPGGVMSQIRTGAAQAGQYGSNRQGQAEGIAARGYLNTIGDVTGKMASENYQQAATRANQALAIAPQTFALGAQPGAMLAGVGQQGEVLAQTQEDYAAQGRLWDLNAQWAPLQNYANIVYGGANPSTTATSMGTGGGAQQSRFGSAIGMAAQGASIGSMIPGVGTLVGGGIGLLAGLFM